VTIITGPHRKTLTFRYQAIRLFMAKRPDKTTAHHSLFCFPHHVSRIRLHPLIINTQLCFFMIAAPVVHLEAQPEGC
jgi:hypothetical protein